MKSTHCLCFTVLAFGTGACVNRVPIEGMPCPCAEGEGYTCCTITNRCLPTGQACQADAGATTDAGQSKWQPLASVSVDWLGSGPFASFLMGDRFAIWNRWDGHRALTYRFAQNDWQKQSSYWPAGAVVGFGLVWTGSQVVYWGGVVLAGLTSTQVDHCNNQGGIYSPATDTWSPINTTGIPALAVEGDYFRGGGGYTGREVVLRGSSCIPEQSSSPARGPVIGVLYDPTTDIWRPMSTVNAPTTINGTNVVLGEKVVCWCGTQYVAGTTFDWDWSGLPPPPLSNAGAVYNVADDTWTAMSTTNAPSPRVGMLALAMRGKMFIWGGTDRTTNSLGEMTDFHDGAIFDPETNTWTPISKEGSPTVDVNLTDAVVAEEQGLVYLWAHLNTYEPVSPHTVLWTYDPSADQWASVDLGDFSTRDASYFVWTGADLLDFGAAGENTMGVFRYTP